MAPEPEPEYYKVSASPFVTTLFLSLFMAGLYKNFRDEEKVTIYSPVARQDFVDD